MHKIDHATATVANEFTEGNPQTAVKPTVVTAAWLNALQNEISNFITAMGITLNKADNTQLKQALDVLSTTNDSTFTIQNNQSNTLMGAVFEFDMSVIKSVTIEVDLYRKDSTQEASCIGHIHILNKPIAGSCEVIPAIYGDEDVLGLVFGADVVTNVAKLKYSSSNYIGANYEGKMVFRIKKFLR